MDSRLHDLAALHNGLLTSAALRSVFTENECRRMVRHHNLHKIWHGIYSVIPPDTGLRLRSLDKLFRCRVVACLHTAAELHGFDVDSSTDLHIIDPLDRHRSRRAGLFVHQRDGAPLEFVGSQIATTPAWTAIELARSQRRPRALATLDAAVRSSHCSATELAAAADRQAGRRGIVAIRSLLPLVNGDSQSPMESESRLLMIDGGLPIPDLQHPVIDEWGKPKFFLDFAWRREMVGAEYDGDEFHGGPLAVRRDKARIGWLQDRGWLIVTMTADDVRRRPRELVSRLAAHLRARAA